MSWHRGDVPHVHRGHLRVCRRVRHRERLLAHQEYNAHGTVYDTLAHRTHGFSQGLHGVGGVEACRQFR